MKPVDLYLKNPCSNKKARLTGIAMAACFFALPVSTAYAGFEWTPPPKAEKPLTPLVKAAPAPNVTPMPLSREMMADKTSTGMIPDSVIEREVLTGLPQTPANYEIREGFGRDIALALAMRQIVPEGYAYSFDPGIDPGMPVSWDGGKPWNEILEEAVAPYNLALLVVNKTAWILPVEKIRAYEEKHGLTPARRSASASGFDDHMAQSRIKEPVFPYHGADAPISLTPSPMDAGFYDDVPSSPSGMKTIKTARAQNPDSPDYKAIGLSENDEKTSYPRRTKPTEEQAGLLGTLKNYTDKIKDTLAGDEQKHATDTKTSETVSPAYQEQEPVLPVPLYGQEAKTPVTSLQMDAMERNMDMGYMTPPPPAQPVMQESYSAVKWRANAGDRLQDVLQTWSQAAGVTFIWDSRFDFDLPRDVNISGSFPEAVSSVLTIYDHMDPQPRGRLHANPTTGQQALVVSTNI